uniref:Scarecrow-like protein 8 n=1 Tax=Cajanus cajan TaxID=3821 RepID=A0A151U673_CAJCA|nr:Scarecrow-like protein 8 [Cajanus cajan]
MSSPGFPNGGPSDFYGGPAGFPRRSMALQPTNTTHHPLYRTQPSQILLDPSSHIAQTQTPNFIRKRTLAEIQTLITNTNNNNNNNSSNNLNPLLSNYLLRSVKPRTFQHVDFSSRAQFHHLPPNAVNSQTQYSILPNPNANFPPVHTRLTAPQEPDKNSIDHRLQLQELEKQLLEDNDDENGDAVSVITNSEWSDTIQNLITPHKPASPSSTSSTTSSNSSTTSSNTSSICFKQSLTEAASAISEAKFDAATEILNRLSQVSTAGCGSREHAASTQLLFEHSLFFKVALMVANIAILESAFDDKAENARLCVVDFDIGNGNQYASLLHELSARRKGAPATVRITALGDSDADERLKAVGEVLGRHAERLGVGFEFKVVVSPKLDELTRESLGCDPDEPLAVNFAFKLFKMADESVSPENPRDALLRRVKALAPRVVTLVEQEANANTAAFVARVAESCAYYGALFESLESTMESERVRIEEGLSRKVANSVACEGRERVERCEVFGKWRARMSMAGFRLKPLSQRVAESIKARLLAAGNRVSVKVENGGISFGWMGRTLTVASAWC